MNLGSLLSSSILAAVITAVVALIGAAASARTALQINRDKLKLDRELADLKVRQERELAEHRMALEQAASLAQRKAEVAEQVLTLFYRGRRAIHLARSPMIWAEEMVAEEGVPDEVVRNEGYGVLRRLRKSDEVFSQLEASRFTFDTLFGPEAGRDYDAFVALLNRVTNGARTILRYRGREEQRQLHGLLEQARHDAFAIKWSDDAETEVRDPVADELDAVIARVEALCRPALERRELGLVAAP